jgi:hypothetical protein
MHKLFRSLLIVTAVVGTASLATAGELVVRIADGRATVIARDVTVAQILSEWARVGDTRVVNGEKLFGGPVTLELVDMPEKQALDILLRSAAGYMTAPRPQPLAGASLYDRVVILATSQAPVNPPPVPQPFNRQMLQQQQMIQQQQLMQQMVPQPPPGDYMVDDQGNPVGEPGQIPPPGMIQPMPYQVPFPMGPGQMPMPQQPVTSPTPGQLPQQPQPTPLMPYTPAATPDPQPPSGGPFMTPPVGQSPGRPPVREEGGP